MAPRDSWQLWSGFWATSLGTLASRVLGLLRDVATAALLGLGESGVMDAFVLAFRVPNLLRRIFGEGALAASFLPVFTREAEHSPARAWQLLSVLFTWLTIVLAGLVLVAEMGCAAWWRLGGDSGATGQLVGLLATMLPYMVFVCLAAQAAAALQAQLEFRVPALAPVSLNVCWLAAVLWIAPYFAPDKLAQAYVIAFAVLLAGALQFGVQLPALRRLGYRFDYNWQASRDAFWLVVRTMLPVTLGMAVTQLNTLADSLIAWAMAAKPGAAFEVPWQSEPIAYPMQIGAVAAVYYGERFYHLPLGILGVAIATVIYPLLSRHAARGNRAAIGADLTLGLRLVAFTALPAGIGMMLVADPLVRVLFERGQFTADDAARTARMVAYYAAGVWAYCAIPVLVRGYYAAGNRAAPVRIALVAVAVNLIVSAVLVWPLAEVGLAVSTAIAAGVQVVLLTATFSRAASPLAWRELLVALGKSALATAAMSAAVVAVQQVVAIETAGTRGGLAVQLALAIGCGVAVYLLAARLMRMPELRLLLRRPARGAESEASDA